MLNFKLKTLILQRLFAYMLVDDASDHVYAVFPCVVRGSEKVKSDNEDILLLTRDYEIHTIRCLVTDDALPSASTFWTILKTSE